MWTHRFLLDSVGCNLLVPLFILVLKCSRILPVGVPSASHHSWSISFFLSVTYSGLILFLPSPNSETCGFSPKVQFLLIKSGVYKPRFRHKVYSLLLRFHSWQVFSVDRKNIWMNIYVHTHTHTPTHFTSVFLFTPVNTQGEVHAAVRHRG